LGRLENWRGGANRTIDDPVEQGVEKMDDLEVRVVTLEPMRVASVRAVSESPEQDAWERLSAWAEPKGLLDDVEKHPVFGFNNPNPTPDRKEYGYEFWIRVGADTAPDADVEIKEFEGGQYAVTTCKNLAEVGRTWKRLWEWVQSDRCTCRWRRTHELEKPHDPRASEGDLVLDLYLPIEE
jgi:DNA gyrase inhibitor GyrI